MDTWDKDDGKLVMFLCNKSNEGVRVQFEAVADIFQPGIFTALNLEPDNGFPLGRYVSHVILKAALKMKKANRVWLWCQV